MAFRTLSVTNVQRLFTRLPSTWSVVALVIALPIALPIVSILGTLFSPSTEVWSHLRETVLFEYIFNTIALLLWVALLSAVFGIGCAWLTATKDFPGRKYFAWLLILPLAAPAYVIAYAYADLFSHSSLILNGLRELTGFDVGIPPIRSMVGAGLVLSLTLYPYLYLMAYNAFAEQAGSLTEAARTLGAGRMGVFWRVSLPHARPAIAGGLALVLMEAAADFGVVNFYGIPTLTNGIFRTWYAMGEQQAAMQLAGWLFFIVAFLVVLEQLARRGSHANPTSRNSPPLRNPLNGWRSLFAFIACLIPLVGGLFLPLLVLITHSIQTGDPTFGIGFLSFLWNSVSVATVTATLVAICAICLAYAIRSHRESLAMRFGVRTATLGYAIPGMVLAVGALGPLTMLDRAIADWIQALFQANIGLILTGSVSALVLVYMARFLTVAFNSIESGLDRIHPNYDDAAKTLGASSVRLLRRVHLPMFYPALLTAMLLVFVDVIKELPATLILRPFNFETLATRAYRLASDERIAEASTASLLIILIGLVPTALLAMQNFGIRRNKLY